MTRNLQWKTARRVLTIERPLVMGILNATPDSFSDGGEFLSVDDALRRAEQMIAEGSDILDIGGESTRPGSSRVDPDIEIRRIVPVINAMAKRFDTPISVDTSKSAVAQEALTAGAEIINDISGLRWDVQIADIAAATGAGLVLMHSRGDFATMHSQPPVADVVADVIGGLQTSLAAARQRGVNDDHIVLDVGIGFGKTAEQNLELIAKLDKIVGKFERFPILVGTSRKSFIGKLLGGLPPHERLNGSLAAAAIAVFGGAKIVRVHDVQQTVAAVKIAAAVYGEKNG